MVSQRNKRIKITKFDLKKRLYQVTPHKPGVRGEGGGRLEDKVEQVSMLFIEPRPSIPLDPIVLVRPRDPVLL